MLQLQHLAPSVDMLVQVSCACEEISAIEFYSLARSLGQFLG